ncbi:sugar transferase [Deminuibacter soli]|uniref:Sugar transferase n=2 Tax=Deminuibacter soli TaxID=2291815 RepID=A0A3E1NRQ9_9BACT|nr:sugar transferase [Deminuibacter soli]
MLFIGAAAAALQPALQTNGYDGVYACNVYQARNMLIARCIKGNETLPEVIYCDMDMGEQLIAHFAAYLAVTKEFVYIPFILVASSEKHNALHFTARQNVDDIIDVQTDAAILLDKIALLKKYKNLKSRLPYQLTPPQKLIKPWAHVFSRTIDILFAATMLTILSPVLLMIALCIMIESRGPVLYASLRAGKGYKVFKFYKFRTMVPDADKKIEQIKHLNQYDVKKDAAGPMFLKINNDPRVTRLGKLLRNSSLDELPQLINVLLGDMSLVGNRPLPLYEACSLTIDQAAQRFLAPAGITGLWQIKKRGQPNMSVQERIDLDVNYANRHSFLYDMRILINTPKVLMQKADV